MIRSSIQALVLVSCLPIIAWANSPEVLGTFQIVEGTVSSLGRDTKDQIRTTANVYAGENIRTLEDAVTRIQLDDGTYLNLGTSTVLKLKAAKASDGNGLAVNLDLQAGSLLIVRNAMKKLRTLANYQEISVAKGDVHLEVDSNNSEVRVSVLSGSAEIKSQLQTVELQANSQVVVEESGNMPSPSQLGQEEHENLVAGILHASKSSAKTSPQFEEYMQNEFETMFVYNRRVFDRVHTPRFQQRTIQQSVQQTSSSGVSQSPKLGTLEIKWTLPELSDGQVLGGGTQ